MDYSDSGIKRINDKISINKKQTNKPLPNVSDTKIFGDPLTSQQNLDAPQNLGYYLSVFVQDVSKEAVSVGESLRACTLPHTDHSVLLRMQNTALKLKSLD